MAGFAGFVSFIFKNNYHATAWALSAAVIGTAALHLHILRLVGRLTHWHDERSLSEIKMLGILIAGCSLVGIGVYVPLAINSKQEINFGQNNFYLSSIASGLSLISGVLLLLSARGYAKEIAEHLPSLIDEQVGPRSYAAI